MITIKESGMTFGPFPEEQVYQIEKAEAYTRLGESVKVVEFVYRQNNDKLFFIEAKSSSPKPPGEQFSTYIDDISEKFIHSFNLWLTLNLNRRKDNVSKEVLDVSTDTQIFRFILVVHGHEETWLPPLKAALERKMLPEIKIWKHEVIVLNDRLAKARGLIK